MTGLGQCEFKWIYRSKEQRCDDAATVTIAGPQQGENPMNVCSTHEAIIADLSFGDYTLAIKSAKALEEKSMYEELTKLSTEEVLSRVLEMQEETDQDLQRILQSLEWNVFRTSAVFQTFIDHDESMPVEVIVSMKKIIDLLGEGIGHLENAYQEPEE